MAYEVTATRKRPKDFEHLVGQDFVVSTLKNSLRSERVAHAYLFSGPRGVGKTSAARILAKALNCPEGLQDEGCFDWDGAEEIAKGRGLDVIEIDGASNTSVNDVRTIKDEVLFPPQTGRYKIYIIDEVHMLSNSAFNALLKTIEEPPPYIVFIFATTELHKVPATIRSRCQQFMFRLIPLEQIKDRLAEAAAELQVQADDEALYWIAKESTGSMRDAYTLFDQVVSFSEGHITLEKIRGKLGLVGLEQMNELASRLLSADAAGALQCFHDIVTSGVSVEQLVIDLTEYYRGILFVQSGIRREALLGYAPDRFLPDAIGTYTRAQVERIIGILLQIYRDIRYSVDPRYEVELGLARISRMGDFVEPNELYAHFKTLEREMRNTLSNPEFGTGPAQGLQSSGNAGPSAATPGPTPVESSKNGPVQDTSLVRSIELADVAPHDAAHNDRYLSDEERSAIVQHVRKESLTLSSLLEGASVWHVSQETLHLSVETAYVANGIQKERDAVLRFLTPMIPGLKHLEIAVVKKEQKTEQETFDPRSEKVREIFRGEFVNEGERA